MSRYLIPPFGCQANTADSEKTAEIMENLGYVRAKNMEDLISAKNPVLIFNTCSVRQKAEDRIFGLNNKLQELKIVNYKLKIILTGCMMHYSESELKKRLPLFDYFIDIKKIKTLEKIIQKTKILKNKDLLTEKTNSKISALIPISHGCDNFCAYCIVPLARGREISRTVLDVIGDIKKAVANGAKEIWLLGQTVNSYKNEGVKFHNLLLLINDIDGDFWIRLTSPHPKYFSVELIKAMAECD